MNHREIEDQGDWCPPCKYSWTDAVLTGTIAALQRQDHCPRMRLSADHQTSDLEEYPNHRRRSYKAKYRLWLLHSLPVLGSLSHKDGSDSSMTA